MLNRSLLQSAIYQASKKLPESILLSPELHGRFYTTGCSHIPLPNIPVLFTLWLDCCVSCVCSSSAVLSHLS